MLNNPLLIVVLLLFIIADSVYTKPIVEAISILNLTEDAHKDTTIVRKMYDPETKKAWIESEDERIHSRLDIEQIIREKQSDERQKYFAIEKNLFHLLENKHSDYEIKVVISLSFPKTLCLDKTTCTEEILREHAIRVSKINHEHLRNLKKQILSTYHLSEDKEDETEDDDGLLIVTLNKRQIEKLSKDNGIVSIVKYVKPQKGACGVYLSGCQDFKSLSNSSYNPQSLMSLSYLGQNIRAATLESGLNSDFKTCIQNRGTQLGAVDDGTDPHSAWTFECLAQTAPSAKLYHKASIFYFTSRDWILTNNITCIATSTLDNAGEPVTSSNNQAVDGLAYVFPYPHVSFITGNKGYCSPVNTPSYNALCVGNVRHTNENHYEMVGLDRPCANGNYGDPNTQAKNPPAIYGYAGHVFPFDCSGCASALGGDRELPHVVAPGYAAFPCGHSTTCVESAYGTGGGVSGTSFSVQVANGIAACVQSAGSMFKGWPELTRATLILTAHNVYGGYWNQIEDGIDGTGTISGVDAVSFARSAKIGSNNSPVQDGYFVGSIMENKGNAWDKVFKVQIPSTLPEGKHLRVVLTWDSSPSYLEGRNELADLDIIIPNVHCPLTGTDNWGSWDSNVEVAEIENHQITPGGSINVHIRVWPFTIPDLAVNKSLNSIYYAIAWTWVKNHAD